MGNWSAMFSALGRGFEQRGAIYGKMQDDETRAREAQAQRAFLQRMENLRAQNNKALQDDKQAHDIAMEQSRNARAAADRAVQQQYNEARLGIQKLAVEQKEKELAYKALDDLYLQRSEQRSKLESELTTGTAAAMIPEEQRGEWVNAKLAEFDRRTQVEYLDFRIKRGLIGEDEVKKMHEEAEARATEMEEEAARIKERAEKTNNARPAAGSPEKEYTRSGGPTGAGVVDFEDAAAAGIPASEAAAMVGEKTGVIPDAPSQRGSFLVPEERAELVRGQGRQEPTHVLRKGKRVGVADPVEQIKSIFETREEPVRTRGERKKFTVPDEE